MTFFSSPGSQHASPAAFGRLQAWLGDSGNWYLGMGGTGDALLTLAMAHGDQDAKVVFLACQNADLSRQFFDLFQVNALFCPIGHVSQPKFNGRPIGEVTITYSHVLAMRVYEMMSHRMRSFLPEKLQYGDWKTNPDKYAPNIVTTMPLKEMFGIEQENIVCLAPGASLKARGWQRDEYLAILRFYLGMGGKVYSVGSQQDQEFYESPVHVNHCWLTATHETLPEMLKIINGARLVVATDSWLKTYSLLAGVRTKVLTTDWHKEHGTDIFLERSIWPRLEIYPVQGFLNEIQFDEERYLSHNIDVAGMVRVNEYKSGEQHWAERGLYEGRFPCWVHGEWTPVAVKPNKLKAAIIMPCYNNLSFTQAAVESMLPSQPHFVFIDNGSTDGTYDYLKTIPNSHIIRNEKNIYVNPAWNQGFEYVMQSDCDYVCLCNNDVIAGPDWLRPIEQLFASRENEFYYPASNSEPHPDFFTWQHFQQYASTTHQVPLQIKELPGYSTGFCVFYRKEHIKHFFPIPETMRIVRGDDYITEKLYRQGCKAFKVNRCAVWHHLMKTQKIIPEINRIVEEDEQVWQKLLKHLI